MSRVARCCLALCCLVPGSTTAQVAPARLPARVRPASTARPPLPAVRRRQLGRGWVLEGSHPLAAINLYAEVYGKRFYLGREGLWGRLTLRGPKGYARLISRPHSFATMHGAHLNPYHDAVQVAVWSDRRGILDQVRAHPRVLRPLNKEEFDLLVWDIRYSTPAPYVSTFLTRAPWQLGVFDFKESQRYLDEYDSRPSPESDPVTRDPLVWPYHLLPYWIAQEQRHLARTHRLPTPERLAAYLDLSRDTSADGLLRRPYRPLLARLLRAYQLYPLPPTTAARLRQALRSLPPAANRP
jgi:hypothetical protein